MRHNKKFNHLGRKKGHRDAMLSNMATSLILHKRIFTTLAKAKALRKYVEPLINRSKEDTTASRRVVFRYLQRKDAITELFKNISEKVADRPGGYTRILKTGTRLGDNAKMCFIELVDYNENMLKEKSTKKTRTRRSKKSVAAVATDAPVAPVADAVVETPTEGEVSPTTDTDTAAEK
ncbi:MAG: 50S ribosomal protein L17 [Porphyromonadaceae bacterium]|nr:50S ribosomal protein L17 [Porphyromonadaceae bacterium]